MTNKLQICGRPLFAAIVFISLVFTSCSDHEKQKVAEDPVAGNIKKYTAVWDDIMNKGMLGQFNDSNFTKDIILHMEPANSVGIDSAKAYYANFLTAFSGIKLTVKNIFGQGDQLVKHWNFTGKHTGDLFGIPATGKTVNFDGCTIARMVDGKIAEEEDFLDNLELMTQLGVIPAPGH